jgi:hypothetical protein
VSLIFVSAPFILESPRYTKGESAMTEVRLHLAWGEPVSEALKTREKQWNQIVQAILSIHT